MSPVMLQEESAALTSAPGLYVQPHSFCISPKAKLKIDVAPLKAKLERSRERRKEK
jgi:hypothetical protein